LPVSDQQSETLRRISRPKKCRIQAADPGLTAIVYNELVANEVALQTVVDQTQALHALKSKGSRIDLADVAFLSPYATSKLKRIGLPGRFDGK
jgi:Tn3 transposase DDE domain